MKILLAVVLSAAFIWLTHETPVQINNSDTDVPKVQTVQAKLTETKPQATPVVVEEKAPTEPQAVIEPEKISHPTGCENYRHLISQYDWNDEVMLQIANKESGCNPSAVGDNRVIGGIYAPSCGIFQVRTLKSRPTCEALKDPATNIAWAYRIYQGQGYNAWSVCNSKVKCM